MIIIIIFRFVDLGEIVKDSLMRNIFFKTHENKILKVGWRRPSGHCCNGLTFRGSASARASTNH